jgi:hypothetical protein
MSARNAASNPATPPRLSSIHALRGVASLSVAWFHLTNTYSWGPARYSGDYGWLGVDAFFFVFVFFLSVIQRELPNSTHPRLCGSAVDPARATIPGEYSASSRFAADEPTDAGVPRCYSALHVSADTIAHPLSRSTDSLHVDKSRLVAGIRVFLLFMMDCCIKFVESHIIYTYLPPGFASRYSLAQPARQTHAYCCSYSEWRRHVTTLAAIDWLSSGVPS